MIAIEAGPDAPKQAQAAMINAKPGDVIEFGAGRFDFRATLSLDVSHVIVRGKGPDKTFLSFKDQGQGTGGEGLLVTSKEDVTLQDLAVEDAKGDAIKVQGTKRIIFRNIRAEWTGGPKETNGGYGFYPVLCTDVVIEDCKAIGASDAGIYVGQSENIIVRRNTAEKNVAGIEIENSIRADVHDNLATDNSGGILVFTMPDLPKKDGQHCRVYHNTVRANNHDNFAPKGNTVASVPPGTGIMIMANDQVEVFDNTIEQNQTAGLTIVSYLIMDKPLNDPKYDPFCESIHIHDNRFSGNGAKPAGALGEHAGQGGGHTAARHPLRRRRRPRQAGRRQAARGPGHTHPRQRRGRLRQLRRPGTDRRRRGDRRKAAKSRPRPQGIRRRAPGLEPVTIEGMQ